MGPFSLARFSATFVSAACSTLASRGLAVVLGYEVYELTQSPLSLGILGLVEAIPALSLALYGGHVADRSDRRRILRTTLGALVICAAILAVLERTNLGKAQLILLYGIVFLAGIARGFAEPAAAALEAQVVPWELLINSSTLMAGCWMTAAVLGPLAGGVAYARFGASWTFVGVGTLYAMAWSAISRMEPKPVPPAPADESVWQSVATGVRYVMGDQVLLGSMALDLFAVLFGGAIALLPVFAKDILGVGPIGLGVLNAAPDDGRPFDDAVGKPAAARAHAGRNLFCAVAGFGVSMIVFALSRNFTLSVIAPSLAACLTE